MAITTDLTTDVGKVRALTHDKDEANPIFTDEEYTFFLAMEGSDYKMAAALAYETMAGSQAILLKVIQTLDLKTDGQKTAQSLLEVAKRLRDTAESAAADWAGFDFAEQVDNSGFAFNEKLTKLLVAEEA